MIQSSRLTGQFALAVSLAAALWMVPASAAETSNGSSDAAKAAIVAPAATATAAAGDQTPRPTIAANSERARSAGAEKPRHVRRHYVRDDRPASYYQRRIRDVISRECSGVWCGRAFVLLLGIGF